MPHIADNPEHWATPKWLGAFVLLAVGCGCWLFPALAVAV